MPLWLVALSISAQPLPIVRDNYGVPQVRADSQLAAMRLMGRAVADDRLWQMEISRRVARGRLAEIMGQSAVASDIATFKMGYSDAEMREMLSRLRPQTRQMFEQYAQGVNDAITNRKRAGTLPPGYAQYGLAPEPWTVLDSAAIGVRLARLFGTGGAGELRNYLLSIYLKGQKAGPKYLDVLDDLAWFNDPSSPVTVSAADDPLAKTHPAFRAPNRAETSAHLASLPPSNLFELLPAVQLASMEDTRLVAEANNVLFKTGSYAIVVDGKRSKTGKPLLLGGPQMGHTIPSVVHEISIQAPGMRVTGMNVPGIPGVLIGSTPDMAWTLTSGVADVTDIFYNAKSGQTDYLVDGKARALEVTSGTIRVKGGQDVRVERMRTHLGPVVLDSKAGNVVYSQRTSFWKRELDGIEFIYGMLNAKTGKAAMAASDANPLTFNLFFAARNGDIGWRYCGLVPLRNQKLDPRFPTPGDTEHAWLGFIPNGGMPHVLNPKSGVITNWNNKPVEWWPNWDTPVWGTHFRIAALRRALPTGQMGAKDLEKAIWSIARQDEGSWTSFMPLIRRAIQPGRLERTEKVAAGWLLTYDGWNTQGSKSAVIYNAVLAELKQELFVPHTGNFVSTANLNLIVQTSPLYQALTGKTKFDYRAGSSADAIILRALKKAVTTLAAREKDPMKWGFNPGGFRAPDGTIVPHANRGTYIQVLALDAQGWNGHSVAEPGIAESGPHSADQIPLAREWRFKPIWRP